MIYICLYSFLFYTSYKSVSAVIPLYSPGAHKWRLSALYSNDSLSRAPGQVSQISSY